MGACGSIQASIAEKVALLSKTPFALNFNYEQLEHLASFLTSRRYPEDDQLVLEGAHGTEFFIIVEGKVQITKLDEDKQELFLCSKGEGDFFGGEVLAKEGYIRPTTVTAESACTVLVLSLTQFKKWALTVSDEQRKQLLQLVSEEIITYLKRIMFLESLSDLTLMLLSNFFHYRTFEKGETVFEEGELGRQLYLILKGSVTVSGKDTDGEVHEFATMGPGGYFGEIALMVDMPRTATVTCNERCLLLELGFQEFRNFLHIVPDLQEYFQRVAKDRTADQFKKIQSTIL